jgi:hypothetical protein
MDKSASENSINFGDMIYDFSHGIDEIFALLARYAEQIGS